MIINFEGQVVDNYLCSTKHVSCGRYHHQNCPDRAGVEAELYHFSDVHPAVRPVPIPAARGTRAADQRAEDWEKEANVKKTYDARKASTKKVGRGCPCREVVYFRLKYFWFRPL